MCSLKHPRIVLRLRRLRTLSQRNLYIRLCVGVSVK